MNVVTIIGRMVRDPEVKYTATGKVYSKFTVAVDRPYIKDKPKESDFISCTAWSKIAEKIGNEAAKGSRILVQGSIRTGSYVNKKGDKVYTTDVQVDEAYVVDKNNNAPNFGESVSDDGDVPF